MLLARYQESRTARDQLHDRCRELWGQLHADEELPLDYAPGPILLPESGMAKVRELEARIASAEASIRTLEDPQQAIQTRLAKTFETNAIYKRPPASIRRPTRGHRNGNTACRWKRKTVA